MVTASVCELIITRHAISHSYWIPLICKLIIRMTNI